MLPIYVVNNFGQFNHLIQRMLRDLDIDSVMINNTTPPDEVSGSCRGIVLGGGPAIERAGNCSEYCKLGLPVLGICLGLHVIASTFGGKVEPGRSGGYGAVDIEIIENDGILSGTRKKSGYGHPMPTKLLRSRREFTRLAQSVICRNEALALPEKQIYGLQWHPEVSHSENGRLVYENFNQITLGQS